jgi:alpha-amylase
MYPRIMMWFNMRRNHVGQGTISVPSPFDGDASVPYWYDKIAAAAQQLAHIGITDVLFPGSLMTQSGQFPTADGYGVFDDYDIGSKGKPTRYGDAARLRRAIAICHANGMAVHLDHVMHQRSGGKNGVYRYDSATQKGMGRFPKDPGCFRAAGRPIPPFVPVDPVPSPADDFPFGDELCPINSVPAGYVRNGLLDAGDWLFRTTGADGARLDDMKGINVGFVRDFMLGAGGRCMSSKFFFGEYASGNRNDTNWWVSEVRNRASAIDFDFHYNMAQPMCNNAGSGNFYMGSLAGRGMIGNNPMHAIPFVESMDSDTNGFATVIFNKILGYALMLMGEGLPQIYCRDYLADVDCYGLYPAINNLCWIHQTLAHGWTIPRYRSHRVYVFERSGPPGLIAALNNDVWDTNWKTVTVQTLWPAGTRVHDYTGHNNAISTVDNHGQITIGIPPGADGHGYGAWAPDGFYEPVQLVPPRRTEQHFDGADDLDIPPLTTIALRIGRIWCQHDTAIELRMMNTRGNEADFHTMLRVIGPDGKTVGDPTTNYYNRHSNMTGWHTLEATGQDFSTTTRMPFRLIASYQAPQRLERSEF